MHLVFLMDANTNGNNNNNHPSVGAPQSQQGLAALGNAGRR